MIANRIKSAALAVAFVTAAVATASAHDAKPHHGDHHHHPRAELKRLSDRTLGGPSRIVSSNWQGGSIVRAGAYFSGSTYFYSGGDRVVFLDRASDRDDQPYIAPKAKIIDVTQDVVDTSFTPVNGCAYEKGVCVIRGRN